MSNKKRKKDKIRCANKRVDTEKNQNQRIKHVPPCRLRQRSVKRKLLVPVYEGMGHDKIMGYEWIDVDQFNLAIGWDGGDYDE